jgi:hypothetical protein
VSSLIYWGGGKTFIAVGAEDCRHGEQCGNCVKSLHHYLHVLFRVRKGDYPFGLKGTHHTGGRYPIEAGIGKGGGVGVRFLCVAVANPD